MQSGEPQVFDGSKWWPINDPPAATGNQGPVPPAPDGNGQIFVSVISFRDGSRCAQTLQNLFENAQEPDKVIVGLIEQNAEMDNFCLEEYCKKYGNVIYRRQTMRADTIKIIAHKEQRDTCPRIDQIRKLAVHNQAAKGPVFARSLAHKVLGNEEYCMQIDAHTNFVKNWDTIAKDQWKRTGNEFGIISTVPASLGEMVEATVHDVPRQCAIEWMEVGVPNYAARGDGKAVNLKQPLLSHAWSAGFSFAKCHLEETAPYDPYTPYVMGVEQFARYARFWTRGYDTYTPTQNIVYHNYQPNPDGHGTNEWMKRRRERLRKASIARISTYLGLPIPDDIDPNYVIQNVANLGIYGLGKRRSLEQLEAFTHLNFKHRRGNGGVDVKCVGQQWVPYDVTISPIENLYDHADDLDAQPEYPLRTEFVFWQQQQYEEDTATEEINNVIVSIESQQQSPKLRLTAPISSSSSPPPDDFSPFPSTILMLSLWIFGLCAWCGAFIFHCRIPGSGGGKKFRKGKVSTATTTVVSSAAAAAATSMLSMGNDKKSVSAKDL